MKWTSFLYILPVLAMTITSPAQAADLTEAFDAKHKTCLEQIAKDAEIAYEDAMIWRGDGGGRRARHCEAMALFALGQEEEAAHRLDQLGAAPEGGSAEMRANYYAEAANFWILADKPKFAYQSATKGLERQKDHIAARIARARAYAMLGRYDYAQTDLTSVLVFEPDNADALRYRADTHHQQGNLDQAKADVEKALSLNPSSVETALLRGRINEDLRLAELDSEAE